MLLEKPLLERLMARLEEFRNGKDGEKWLEVNARFDHGALIEPAVFGYGSFGG